MATKKKSALLEARERFGKLTSGFGPSLGQRKIISGTREAVGNIAGGAKRLAGGAVQGIREGGQAIGNVLNIGATAPFEYARIQKDAQTDRLLAQIAQRRGNAVAAQRYLQRPSQQLAQYNQGLQQFQQGYSPALFRGALYGSGMLAGPAALKGSIGLGAGISGGGAVISGQDPLQAVGRSSVDSIKFAGLSKYTSPLLNTVANKAKSLPGRMTIQGLGNVAEDITYNAGVERRKTSPQEAVASFLLGAGFEGLNAKKLQQVAIDKEGFLKNKIGRLFDPTSGRFVKATSKTAERIKQAQRQLFENVTGEKWDPSDYVLTERPGGLSLSQKARSRLGSQAGFLRIGKSSDIKNTGVAKSSSTQISTLPISTAQLRMKQPRLNIEATGSTIPPSSVNPQQGLGDSSVGTIPQISKDTQAYLKELTSKQKSASLTPGSKGVVGKAKSLLGSIKESIVDSTSPIEDALSAAEKRGKFKVLPKNDVRLQIDRVLRSKTLASQFAQDNGIVDVIKKAPDLDALDQYLVAKQAAFREGQGIKTGRDLTRDQQLVQELSGTYKPLAQQVNQYSQKLLDYSVQSGLISQDLATQLVKDNPEYVPLQRIFNEIEQGNIPQVSRKGVASLSKQSVVQKIKGSEREIASPIQSLLLKTQDTFTQGERNIAAKQLASYKDLPTFKDLLRELEPGESGKHTISFLDNGVKKTFETTPEIEAAAKSLNQQQMNFVTKILSVPTRVLQVGATGWNVPFTVTNLVKDQMGIFINSNKTARASLMNPVNFVRAFYSAVKHDDLYEEMVRNAGGGTSFDISRQAPNLSVAKIRSGRNVGSKIAYTVKHPGELLKAVEDIIGRSEELSRIQSYRGTRQALVKGGRNIEDARLLAAQAARENTANFARKGSVGQVLNYTIPFFNAGIQGARQLNRSFTKSPIKTSAKVAIGLFTPVAAATAWNLSDPERKKVYEDIDDFEKENNLIIIPDGATKDEKGRWRVIKIPVPPGLSNLASLVRRPIEQSEGLDPVRFGEVANNLFTAATSLDISSPNKIASTFTPQIAKPFVEGVTNTNLFTGGKIIPEYMLNKPAEEQVRDTTSGTARWIGKRLNQSPLQVENAIGTTTGGVGRQLLNTSDRFFSGIGTIPKEQIGGESVTQSLKKRFASASGGKSEEFLYDSNLSKNQREQAKQLLVKDPKKAKEYVDSILQNRKFENDLEEGKKVTIENPTPDQLKKIKKKAVDEFLAGNVDTAKELRTKYKFQVTTKEVNDAKEKKAVEAARLFVNGDAMEAKFMKEQYKLSVPKALVVKEAKKKAIDLFRQGRVEEAKALKEQYGFSVKNSEIN